MYTIFAFGTFVVPLEQEFGWSRGQLSLAVTMTNFAAVIASPCVGIIIDNYGVRKVLIPSVILMGIAVFAMSLLAANIWHFYLLYFLIGFLGAGTLPHSYSRVLIAWFSRRRGIALGVSLSGFGVGAMLVPVFAQFMIENYGWRMAYAGFTFFIFAIALPMVIFVMKETPEELGLKPDGDSDDNNTSTEETRPVTDPDVGLSCLEAAKTGSFWLIFMSFLLVGIGITSILAHLVPMLIDRGVAPETAAYCMSALALGLIIGRVLAGILMDYFFAPYVAALFLLGLLLGIIILATGTSSWLVFVAAVCVGLATGSEISEIAYICGRYFGPRAFGLVYGVIFSAFQIGAMIGSPVMGIYHDKAGDYIGALWFVAGLVLIGTILIVMLKPYPYLEKKPEA